MTSTGRDAPVPDTSLSTAIAARGALPRVRGAAAERPEPTLARVLDDLGSTLLTTLVAVRTDAPVSGFAIHDAVDESPLSRTIVLGLGIADERAAEEAVRRIGPRGAVALVVRLPFAPSPELRELLVAHGVTLAGLAERATWQQLISVLPLATAGSPSDADSSSTLGGFIAGDLFGLASAICELVDAPITIEDEDSNVLAYSERQDEADFIRSEVILGRRTPDEYRRRDETRGASRDIRHSMQPVHLPRMILDDERETMPRVAMAVRAGGEFLGSIWAVTRTEFTPEQDRWLLEASRVVALHMLHLRANSAASRRQRVELVATALEGGDQAANALTRLGLDERPALVVALAPVAPEADGGLAGAGPVGRVAALERTAAAFALEVAATWADSTVAVLDAAVYAIIAARGPGDVTGTVQQVCERFASRRSPQLALVAGIGRIVTAPRELALSRADADRAVRVLRRGPGGRRAAPAADLEIESLVLDLRDIAASGRRGPVGPYARLLEHDAERGSHLVETLAAWLGANGDAVRAAAAMHVHQNTFRYRLARLAEIGGFDPADAEARFALQLQLRVYPPR